jgi:hypothetical protein
MLDRLQDRHRHRHLLLPRGLQRVLERHEDEVGRTSLAILRARDPDRRVEQCLADAV